MIDYAAEYDNSARVEGAERLIATYSKDAEIFRARNGLIADYGLRYGDDERNQLDIFWPNEDRAAPLSLFIHGGYWQHLSRSDFSHLAQGLLGHGIAVAMPSYTLAPKATVSQIIMEMRRACLLINQTYKRPITVFGHSAGGHLAACMMATDWAGIHSSLPEDLVQSGMGISGIYDLIPLLQTPVNDALKLSREDAHENSPLHWLPPALQRFETWVGETESNEYHRQSRSLATSWTMAGTPTPYLSVEGENHFTIVNALTDPQSDMVLKLVDLVNHPQTRQQIAEPDEAAILKAMESFSQADA